MNNEFSRRSIRAFTQSPAGLNQAKERPTSEAADSHITSRRKILAGLAVAAFSVIPSLAVALPNPDAELFAIEAAFEELEPRMNAAMSAHNRAEGAVFEWRRRNPKPKMRECHVGTNAEYDVWARQVADADDPADVTAIDPNADLKAAIKEQCEQLEKWSRRHRAAKARCGFEAKEAAWTAVTTEHAKLCSRAEIAKATTLPGLICKARLSNRDDGNSDIADAIVRDLLAFDSAKVTSLGSPA